MLSVKSLTKVHPGRAHPTVDNVDLTVKEGEVVGLVGLNGAGKTTLVRICAGVSRPTSGSVSVLGLDMVSSKAEASAHVGWVPEYPNFEPTARALDQLTYYAGFYGESGADARAHCERLLAEVGLGARGLSRLRTYSQGMKKRFSLAAALLGDPEVLLLDEILNGLDPEGVQDVRGMMVDLRDQGTAILLSSHILAEVERVADRVAVLHQGRLRKTWTRADLERSSRPQLNLTIPRLDDRALAYLGTLGRVERQGGRVTVKDPSQGPGSVNAHLVGLGYEVTHVSMGRENLEALFLQAIEPPPGPGAQAAE